MRHSRSEETGDCADSIKSANFGSKRDVIESIHWSTMGIPTEKCGRTSLGNESGGSSPQQASASRGSTAYTVLLHLFVLPNGGNYSKSPSDLLHEQHPKRFEPGDEQVAASFVIRSSSRKPRGFASPTVYHRVPADANFAFKSEFRSLKFRGFHHPSLELCAPSSHRSPDRCRKDESCHVMGRATSPRRLVRWSAWTGVLVLVRLVDVDHILWERGRALVWRRRYCDHCLVVRISPANKRECHGGDSIVLIS
jgi:hypothetical protein